MIFLQNPVKDIINVTKIYYKKTMSKEKPFEPREIDSDAETKEQMNPEKLKAILNEAKIDTTEWGQGKAKTLEHLAKEVIAGETEIARTTEGKLVRRITVGKADIYYYDKESGNTYKLVEDKQIFKDGRERKRNLDAAISEKFKPDENPQEAIMRGIQEELNIKGEMKIEEKGMENEEIESPSYPGLNTQYVLHRFETFLERNQFNKEGYKEEQPDKTTYFIWKEVNI